MDDRALMALSFALQIRREGQFDPLTVARVAVEQADALTSALSKPPGEQKRAEEALRCPKCEGPMWPKNGVRGQFYGCKKWPDCNGIRNLDGSPGGFGKRQLATRRQDKSSLGGDYTEPPMDDDVPF